MCEEGGGVQQLKWTEGMVHQGNCTESITEEEHKV
jgi:hypothetical protein